MTRKTLNGAIHVCPPACPRMLLSGVAGTPLARPRLLAGALMLLCTCALMLLPALSEHRESKGLSCLATLFGGFVRGKRKAARRQ